MVLYLVTTVTLAPGAAQNFTAYHIYVDGNAKLSYRPVGVPGCIFSIFNDISTGGNANEILMQAVNVSGSTLPIGTTIAIEVTVGI